MTVRAKFSVKQITQTEEGYDIVLEPVVGESEENKKFFKYTPWGHIKMGIVNEEAVKEFFVGKEYYVDFNLVE